MLQDVVGSCLHVPTDFLNALAGEFRHPNFLEQCCSSIWPQHVRIFADRQDKCLNNEHCWSHQGLDAHWPLCRHFQSSKALQLLVLEDIMSRISNIFGCATLLHKESRKKAI